MGVTARRLVVASALIGIGVVTGIGSGSSGAAGTEYQGNAATCAAIGMSGYLDSGFLTSIDGTYSNAYLSWTISGGDKVVDVTDKVYNAVIHAIVVKGGNGYYVYSSPEPGMTAPPTGNGSTPRISHWFVCYELGPTTTSTSTTSTSTTSTSTTSTTTSSTVPTTSSTSTTSTTSTSTTSTSTPTTVRATTTTDAIVNPPFDPDLPDTGGASFNILSLATIVTGIGAFLRALIRRPA